MHEVEDGKITLSTGVVLKIIDVPLYAFDAVRQRMTSERPKVPTGYIEAKDRDEPNPNDPDYIAAIEDYDAKVNGKLVDMVITLGTEVESIPSEFPEAKDKTWADKITRAGILVPDEEHERSLVWMKLCAMRTGQDLQSVLFACLRNAGVTEEDVAVATASFPNRKKR